MNRIQFEVILRELLAKADAWDELRRACNLMSEPMVTAARMDESLARHQTFHDQDTLKINSSTESPS